MEQHSQSKGSLEGRGCSSRGWARQSRVDPSLQQERQLNSCPLAGKPWQGLINFLSSSFLGEFTRVLSCVNPQHSLHGAQGKRQSELLSDCPAISYFLHPKRSVTHSYSGTAAKAVFRDTQTDQGCLWLVKAILQCPFLLNVYPHPFLDRGPTVKLGETSGNNGKLLIPYYIYSIDI